MGPFRNVLLAVAVLSVAGTGGAQQVVPSGAKVRLAIPDSFPGWRVARVSQMTADSIRLTYADGDSATLALAQLYRLEASHGRRTPVVAMLSPIATIPLGAVAGAMVGLMAGASGDWDDAIALGFGVGAAAGLVSSIAIMKGTRHEQWSPLIQPVVPGFSTATAASTVPSTGRLRLLVAGRNIDGTFVEQRGDTIVMSTNAVHTRVPVSAVSDVYVSRGKDQRGGALTGLKWGAVVGVGVGALVVTSPNTNNALRDPDCPDDGATICPRESDFETAAYYVAGSALVGTAIGAVVGKERWVRTSLPARSAFVPRVHVSPNRRGVTVAVRATF